jgi:hypothetical protein
MPKKSTTTKSRKPAAKKQPKAAPQPVPAWSKVASQVVEFVKSLYNRVVSYFK